MGMSQLSITKRSKDYSKLLDNVIENELIDVVTQNNEALWVAMGNELEIQGIDKSQISTIVRKDIEEMLYDKQFKEFLSREEYRYNNSKYFIVMKDNGWTNPVMARNVKSSDPVMDQDNSSIYTKNNDMIELCYDIIDVCRTMIDKSKSDDIKPFEDVIGEKKISEFYKQITTSINNCKNAIDHKTKVPKNTELFLLECLSTILGNTNKCAQVFMEQNLLRLKDQGKFFTLKQATKFQNGGRQSQLTILKPISRDTALYLDYSGVQCTCGSWRVRDRSESNNLECYDCDAILPKQHISKCENCQIPLYKERIQWMLKHKNKCQNCDTKVNLPAELIQSIKS